MKTNKLFISFIFLIVGCSTSKVAIDKLLLKQGKYYYIGSTQTFNGKAISKFDNGNVSSIIEFKNGIPDGNWITYGYKSEIVQEGNYIPLDISIDSSFKNRNIFRVSLCTTKEGNSEFTDAFVITNTPYQFKEDEFKPILKAYIKSHAIVVKGDSLNEIKFVKGELDTP